MNILRNHIIEISTLCKKHNVQTLYAFGSVLENRFSKNSDIDLLVVFMPIDVEKYADNYCNFKFALEDLLHYPIDLLEENAVKNPYFREAINQSKQQVYG
jgi:uncharacterized protein